MQLLHMQICLEVISYLFLAISIVPFTSEVRVVRSFRNCSSFPWTMSFGRASLDVAPGLMAKQEDRKSVV